jgi:hypothetical protein
MLILWPGALAAGPAMAVNFGQLSCAKALSIRDAENSLFRVIIIWRLAWGRAFDFRAPDKTGNM